MKYLNYHYVKLMVKAFVSIVTMKWNKGFCPVCGKKTVFLILDEWLRDYYRCVHCLSIPRQRALQTVLDQVCPNWKDKVIHESSPSGPLSKRISQQCSGYTGSQYYSDIPSGAYKGKVVSQNLEQQTFPDKHFDIVITQDVMEHVLHPKMAFAEIERTLKPGGIHIFTVPTNFEKKTEFRVADIGDQLEYLKEPVYHKSPVDINGTLVVTDWGYDITDIIQSSSNMVTEIFNTKNSFHGIDGEYLEVIVSKKAY